MNFTFTAIIGLSVIALALIVLLRQYRPEFALILSVICAAALLLYGVVKSADIINTVNDLASRSGIDENNILLVLKALGVCYLTQIAKDICVDCSQTALADRVDFIGKITVTALSLPMIMQVVTLITDLIS